MSKLEYCFKCGELTGKAGAGDDSLYTESAGPFCESCFAFNAAPAVANVQHDSDCSTNNRGVPELLGPCDCSVVNGAAELPPLPKCYGTIYVYQLDEINKSVDGWTAEQMRGYAIDYGMKLGRAAIASAQQAAPKLNLMLAQNSHKNDGEPLPKGDCAGPDAQLVAALERAKQYLDGRAKITRQVTEFQACSSITDQIRAALSAIKGEKV